MTDYAELALAKKAALEGRFEDCMAILLALADEDSERGALAAYSLGILYEGGMGITEDKAKAFDLYLVSEAHGYDMATYRLAILLKLNGDFAEALCRFRRIAQSNASAAWQAYLIMSNKPELSDGSEDRFLREAAIQGHLKAKRMLLAPALKGKLGAGRFFRALADLCRLLIVSWRIVKNGEKLKYQ